LKEVGDYDKGKLKLLFSGHHLSHAASAYYPSTFEEAAILTIDGVGEWATASIFHGQDGTIRTIKEMPFPHSVGLLYSAFTYFLGFTVNSGEYKVMGLAPFGNENSEETKEFIEKIKNKIVSIKEDGSIWLNQTYFNYASGLKMIDKPKWENLFNMIIRTSETNIEQKHCNLAYAIQHILEEIVVKMAKEAKRLTKSNNLCLAGGVALNCVANSKIKETGIFDNIYIQPAAGDCGSSIGAALAVHHMYFENSKSIKRENANIYLGPESDEQDITILNRRYKTVYNKYDSMNDLSNDIAKLISEGNVVGWFQDKMEFGPRALGNRSILADPRNSKMQELVNRKIKLRENFRPFAPAVTQEQAQDYFELEHSSPYMLYTAKIKPVYRNTIPNDFHELSIDQKGSLNNSIFPAITHIDYSARIQTVSKDANPKFWQLLQHMKVHSGHPIVLNTSLNVRGEPIVSTPQEAYDCFMNTEMDVLVLHNYVYFREQQSDSYKTKSKFKLD
ncbi:MAG: carbamoyltransferase C-terminal domain-containing protein, partial [Gelidibacter sp.]